MIKNRDKLETVNLDQQQLKLDQIACNLIKSSSTSLPVASQTCKISSLKIDSVCNLFSNTCPPLQVNEIVTVTKIESTLPKDLSSDSKDMTQEEEVSSVEIVQEVHETSIEPIRPLVFCGPSGSGKSTLLKKLLREYKDCFGFSISHTTRKPRNGEVDGKDYYFVERETILKAIENGEFIEHAEFAGNIYGTSKKAVRDVQNQKKICILDIDIEGVKNLKKTDINPIYIFVKPPSIDVLEHRLRQRGSETEENIKKRLLRAVEENAYGEVEKNFDILIVNDNFEEAYTKLRLFVESHYNVTRTVFEPLESRSAPSVQDN